MCYGVVCGRISTIRSLLAVFMSADCFYVYSCRLIIVVLMLSGLHGGGNCGSDAQKLWRRRRLGFASILRYRVFIIFHCFKEVEVQIFCFDWYLLFMNLSILACCLGFWCSVALNNSLMLFSVVDYLCFFGLKSF